jgi:alpha-amylase
VIFRAIFAGITALLLLVANFAAPVVATDPPAFKPIVRGDLADDSVYFVMTDRFENGKTDNDEAFVGGGIFRSGYDPTSISYWHGGDFVGLTKRLEYIKELGFTSIWITPPVLNNWIQGDSGAYHGYWGTDFTTIDPHLGTEAEFKEFVTEAQRLGMKVIVDIVVNHTGDIISPKIGMYSYRSISDFPYRTATGQVFDVTKFAGKKNFPKLDPKKSFPYEPTVATANRSVKKPNWLNDVTNYHNRDSTFSGESSYYGDFFGLDDVFTEKPVVVKGWTKVWSDWITKFNIDGYRIDTAKHVNPEFWVEFLPKVKKAAVDAGKEEFPIFGEVADGDPAYLATFLAEQEFPSILDFNFQNKAMRFVQSQFQAYRMVELFNADDYWTTATTSAYGQPTFLGNHDMGRVGYFLHTNMFGDMNLTLKRSLLGNEVLFFSRGAPVLYYGDEKGMIGTGGDKAARQNMFPTQVEDWKSEPRIGSTPIGNRSAFDVKNPLEAQITEIQRLIRQNPALRSGAQQLRSAKASVVAMTRYLDGQEYLVVFNSSEEESSFGASVVTANSTWSAIYGKPIKIESSGSSISGTVAPLTSIVLKADKKVTHPEKIEVNLRPITIDYNTQNWLGLSATVPGNGYNQVNFQMRVKGSKNWINLGTADRRTLEYDLLPAGLYRGFIQPRKFKSGTAIEVIAIARNDAGATAYSKIRSYKIKY